LSDVAGKLSVGIEQPRPWRRRQRRVRRAGFAGAVPRWPSRVRARRAMQVQWQGLQMDFVEQCPARAQVLQVQEV